jgi:HAD superfamily hydrolase (TIGR01484 family)
MLGHSKDLTVPKPWEDASVDDLQSIRGVCLDIDDTLSTSGKLTDEAYSALWSLKNAGFKVVPITGRPAGWCDHFARFWPVDAIVGENGAFTFFMNRGIRKRIDTPAGQERLYLKDQLTLLSEKIQVHFPKARWASDQSYREYDLAIDICEDVDAWSAEDVESLLTFCRQEGAHAKLSSIHVNTWFGEYDKRKGFEHWLSEGAPGCEGLIPERDKWLYIGDSPNDEPMFASFPCSVGVANLKKYLPQLKNPPTWITQKESGEGFAEMAKKLTQFQKQSSSKK